MHDHCSSKDPEQAANNLSNLDADSLETEGESPTSCRLPENRKVRQGPDSRRGLFFVRHKLNSTVRSPSSNEKIYLRVPAKSNPSAKTVRDSSKDDRSMRILWRSLNKKGRTFFYNHYTCPAHPGADFSFFLSTFSFILRALFYFLKVPSCSFLTYRLIAKRRPVRRLDCLLDGFKKKKKDKSVALDRRSTGPEMKKSYD